MAPAASLVADDGRSQTVVLIAGITPGERWSGSRDQKNAQHDCGGQPSPVMPPPEARVGEVHCHLAAMACASGENGIRERLAHVIVIAALRFQPASRKLAIPAEPAALGDDCGRDGGDPYRPLARGRHGDGPLGHCRSTAGGSDLSNALTNARPCQTKGSGGKEGARGAGQRKTTVS